MARKGLVSDPREERVRGLDPEKEDEKALKRWNTLDDGEKIRELTALRDDMRGKLQKLGLKEGPEVAAITKGIGTLKYHSKKVRKANANLDQKRAALLAQLQKMADLPVPEDSDEPAAKKVLELRKFLAEYNREETFDEAWAKGTDRERIENAYRWCNNMTANNYAVARKMGFTPENVEEFREKIMKFDAIITGEERIAHIVDTNSPFDKARADMLMQQMDAKKQRQTFITHDDILGRKGN